MSPKIEHFRCTGCGERQYDDPPGTPDGQKAYQKLLLKRVEWRNLGNPANYKKDHWSFKARRIRQVGWYCVKCLEKDPQWNLPQRRDMPQGRGWSGTFVQDD